MKKNIYVRSMLIIVLMSSQLIAFSQTNSITGKITDANGNALIGVSIALKGTTKGAVSDKDGAFTIDNVANGSHPILSSFVGYTAKETNVNIPMTGNLTIQLEQDVSALDEVIVTGVLDARSRMESSVAISTLNTKNMSRMAPVSGIDLLKNIAGVYVNSSNGEIRNVIYSRGISANSNASFVQNANGYFYVSLQEDGMPVTNITSSDISPDMFFRYDATVNRLEAVRGGSSAISSNAPGGIFNYTSKEGGQYNEFRVKLGLEGDASNPYYRADLVVGDNLKNGWSYNAGGFYRYATGSRNAGYPLNFGGQIKGNLIKTYATGSLKLYAKLLDDTNGTTYAVLASGFDNPVLAPGVKLSDSYMHAKGVVIIPNGSDTETTTFDPTALSKSKDFTVGLNWKQDLGSTWTIGNNLKYSEKVSNTNVTSALSYVNLTDVFTYILSGFYGGPPSINLPGTVNFNDRTTGANVAQVSQSFVPLPTGGVAPVYKLLNSDLPAAFPGSLLFQGANIIKSQISEFMDKFTIGKKLKNGSINAGIFYGSSRIAYDPSMGAAVAGFAKLENQPQRLNVTFDAVTGKKYQITDPQGYIRLGGANGFRTGVTNQKQFAAFLGNNLTFAEKLNFDWGVRFESNNIYGYNNQTVPNTKKGGIDGNILTAYDDFYQVKSATNINYNKTISTFSYSAGLNYKLNEDNAIYVRYSNGQKAPDLSFYQTYTSNFQVDNNLPIAQTVEQLEAAYKLKGKKANLIVTPFLSNLKNVLTNQLVLDDKNNFYYTQPLYNSVQTVGVEIETDVNLTRNFNIKGAFTFQDAKYTLWRTTDAGAATRDDDKIVDYTNNKAENNPSAMFTVTPTYSTDKFYAFVQWRYMGKRPVNQPNAFDLPAFNQFDLGAGYTVNRKLSLSLNVNNLANSLAIMASGMPGSFLQTAQPQSVTKAIVEANKNATHSVIALQPRAVYLTASYKF